MSLEQDYAVFDKILRPYIREPLCVNRSYLSPIPRGNHYETSGSLRVFEFNNNLYWKDWGISQPGSRPEHLIMMIHNVSYAEAEQLIDTDIPEGQVVKRQRKYKLALEDSSDFLESELLYWMNYGVQLDTLELFNVRGVRILKAGENYLFNNGTYYTKEGVFGDRIAFSYRGGENLEYWQFYIPDPKDFYRKGMFILGMDQLPKVGDNLILISGLKDGMAFYEATGLPFLSGSGEGAWKQFKPHMTSLQKRFKNIYTLFDPDLPGRDATNVFRKELGISPLKFPYPDMRDIADLSRDMGSGWLGTKIYTSL